MQGRLSLGSIALLALVALSGAPALLPAAKAQAAREPASPSVVGVWQLIEYKDWKPDGTLRATMGDAAQGIFVYSPDGHLSLHISPGRSRPRLERDATDREVAQAFEPYIGYYGTYDVDYEAMTIIHHVQGAKLPNREGRSAVRPFRFEGEDLVLDFTSPSGSRYLRRLRRLEDLN